MATKTATPNGKGSSGGGLGNMGVAALFRENANKAATKPSAVIENRPFKGEATATPNGGSTSGGGMGGMGVAGEAWRLAAEKAGINVEALSQTEKDILRTGGVKAYQEYLWEDERTNRLRPDGSKKSAKGFLGPMEALGGKTSTEISAGFEINGKETLIPLMVPGLTKEELDYLLKTNTDDKTFMKNLPNSIAEKAIKHAEERMKKGKSVFYVDGE